MSRIEWLEWTIDTLRVGFTEGWLAANAYCLWLVLLLSHSAPGTLLDTPIFETHCCLLDS